MTRQGFSYRWVWLPAGGVVVLLLLHLFLGESLPWLINLACFFAGAVPLLVVIVHRKAIPLVWIFGPLAFLVFLGGLETGLRVGVYRDRFYPMGVGKHYSPHPLLFWTQKPRDRVRRFETLDRHLQEWNESEGRIDAMTGIQPPVIDFRSGVVSPQKHPISFRIITLGGSNAYGYRVEHYEDTFTGRLAEMIRAAHPDRPIEVIAAGQPGYGAFQNLVLYKIVLRKYKPDLIILYANINDLFQHLGPYTYREYFYKQTGVDVGRLWIDRFEFPKTQSRVMWVQEQLQRLHLYNWATAIITGFRNDAIFHRVGNVLLKEVNPIEDYRKNLEDLVAIARKDGVKVVFADAFYYPHAIQVSPGDSRDLVRNAMAEVAREQGVPFVPIHEILLKRDDLDAITFDFDREHINEEGHRLVAEILFAEIEKRGLLVR